MQNQIPKNWQKVKLGEVADVISGFAFKSSEFTNKGLPVIKIRNIASGVLTLVNIEYYDGDTTNLEKYLINKGDILVSMTGSHVSQWSSVVGKITRNNLDQKFLMNQRVGKIKPDPKKINNNFLYYILHNDEITLHLANRAGGSANQANISPEIIKSLEIIIPVLPEQNRVALVLSSFDDKIEVNNKIAKTLEEMAQAIFKEWFVHFRFPGYEKAEFVDSELGKIPKGWSVGTLGELMEIKHGFAFPSEKFKTEGDIPVIKIKNIQEDKSVNLEDVDFVKLEDFTINLDNFKLSNGDVLVALTGATSGKIGILIGSYEYYFLNQRVGKFAFHKLYNKWFSYIFLTRPSYRNLLLTSSDGSAQGNLSPRQIKSINLVIPSDEMLERFNNLVESFYKEIIKNKSENQKLAALRDLLLPKLMRGEVRI